MSLLKLRELDKFGVITDVDGFDLPPGAWSMAINLRFEDGRVKSAPVWRSVANTAYSSPRFLYSSSGADAASSIFVGYLDGSVYSWSANAEFPASPTGFAPSEAEAVWTACTLAQVTYINREDRVPWAMRLSDARFSQLAGWDSNWRARIIRSYNSALIALNVTKSGVRYPTMVKTSDLVTDPSTVPPSWDHTVTTNNATENVLTEMDGEIVDAAVLGNALFIYSNTQTWAMLADGSPEVYQYKQLPYGCGAIGPNCVVQVKNMHYVFGSDDIWAHDGLTHVSIADGRVRKFIFKTMNAKASNRFFVNYNPALEEIAFHYVSGDPWVKFLGYGCNRKAVYNLSNKTWTFDDCPLVFASGYAKVSLDTKTWGSISATWATAGGSWSDLEDGFKRSLIYIGEANTATGIQSKVYAFDQYGADGNLSSPVDLAANKQAVLIRDGIDLDEIDCDLVGYKHILRIYPQGRLEPSAAPITFTFGVTDYSSVPYVYSIPQTYDAVENYQCDFTAGGRFLSVQMTYPDFKTMSLSGLDLEVDVTGSR